MLLRKRIVSKIKPFTAGIQVDAVNSLTDIKTMDYTRFKIVILFLLSKRPIWFPHII